MSYEENMSNCYDRVYYQTLEENKPFNPLDIMEIHIKVDRSFYFTKIKYNQDTDTILDDEINTKESRKMSAVLKSDIKPSKSLDSEFFLSHCEWLNAKTQFRSVEDKYKSILTSLNISPLEFVYLWAIFNERSITTYKVQSLGIQSKDVAIDKLYSMTEKGYIEKATPSINGSRNYYKLTDKGKDLFMKGFEKVKKESYV